MKTVGDIVKDRDVYNVQQDQSVADAVTLMVDHNIGAVAVLDKDKLVGIFTERDLMKRITAKDICPKDIKMSEVMTKDLIAAKPDESYDACLAKMRQLSVRHLVVADGDRLAGLISIRDLINLDLNIKTTEIAMLDSHLQYREMPPS
jgi:CBS domain-containing protein